jgi:carboxymethylenebutenolidase
MIETEIDIPTADGAMNTWLFRPDRPAPLPAVIMYMPASGIREELKGLARRLAAGGYLVLLPNLYYRLARVLDCDANRLKDPDYEPVATFTTKLFLSVTNARSNADTAAMLAWLDTVGDAAPGKVGLLGYCMGGRLVLSAMGAFPDRIAAAVSLYGAGLASDQPDSPHRNADRITGELYFGFADNDDHVPLTEVDRLAAHLALVGTRHRIEIHPNTEHGFAFPLRYCYQEAAAERCWQRIFELFGRTLSAPTVPD